MSKKTVVVTGMTGKVGTNIVQQLLKMDYEVHALVHTPLSPDHPLAFEHVNVTVMDLITLSEQELFNWINRVQPLALIHSAALADVRGCERQPTLSYLMNVVATRMLARASAYAQAHFIMLSTEYVFDGTQHPEKLYCEWDHLHPLNQYGKSKAQGELAAQEECSGKTLWTICRTSVVYGLAAYGSTPWPRPDFLQWIRTTLDQKQTVRVASDQINSPTYVVDLAMMLVSVVEQRISGVYHIAGSSALSRYHFALKIAQQYDLNDRLIQPVLTSELDLTIPRPLNAGLCIDKISLSLGRYPLSIEEGLACCWELEQKYKKIYLGGAA